MVCTTMWKVLLQSPLTPGLPGLSGLGAVLRPTSFTAKEGETLTAHSDPTNKFRSCCGRLQREVRPAPCWKADARIDSVSSFRYKTKKSAVLFTVLTACTPTHSFRDYTDFVTGFAARIWAICINHWKKKKKI